MINNHDLVARFHLTSRGQVGTEGKVFAHKDFRSMILVNVGAAYPNQQLTLVLRGDAKKIASSLDGKQVTIIGKVTEYKSKPQ